MGSGSFDDAFVAPRRLRSPSPFFPTRHRTMSGQQDTRTCEELLAALQAEREAREAAEAALQAERKARKAAEAALQAEREAAVAEIALALREQLRRELPLALEWAVWESRRYHRSVLTGRCRP